MTKTNDLYKKAIDIIPGGSQLFSKRSTRFHPEWPAYYSKAEGCELWDLDGKKYIDVCLMGIGSCILGYADKDVEADVIEIIQEGSMSSLNCPEEVELAELLCELHPWAGKVRFCRSGGEAMSIAVRIARAQTQRDLVLFCGYHGWHDWYLAANLHDDKALDGHLLPGLVPSGVPRHLKGTSLPFEYNDTQGFLELVQQHQDRIAAVVMEPLRNYMPKEGFLETIRSECNRIGAVLIFDEITAGWRMAVGGAHLKLGINPDVAVFAKAMSNGYPMAAIIGRDSIMADVGAYFISSTYWTERIGPVAALATIQKLKKKNIIADLQSKGKVIQEEWKRIADKNNVPIEVSGIYPLSHFKFMDEQSAKLKTIFIELMLKQGYLASTLFYVSYAHTEKVIQDYLNTFDHVFKTIGQMIQNGEIDTFEVNANLEKDFKRLT